MAINPDDYKVNYNDKRLTDVKDEQIEKEAQISNTYDDMINSTDEKYDDLIDASKKNAETQKDLQQQQTDFNVQQIEQNKEKAAEQYKQEQEDSYVDYTRQNKSWGKNAEYGASTGLNQTGWNESSKVAMYSTYQNRVATAKKSLSESNLAYDNNIQEAKLANNVALAEIAANAYKEQAEYALSAFNASNELIINKTNALQNISDTYNDRYNTTLSQIQGELDRQYESDVWNEEFKQKMAQYDEEMRQWQLNYNLEQQKYKESIRQWEQEYALQVANSQNKTTTKLSSSGESLYNKIKSVQSGMLGGIMQKAYNDKSKLANIIDDLYNRGEISESDGDILFSKFGLN